MDCERGPVVLELQVLENGGCKMVEVGGVGGFDGGGCLGVEEILEGGIGREGSGRRSGGGHFMNRVLFD